MALLDGISSPEFLQAIAEQQALVQRIADCFGWTTEYASAALLQDDIIAMETFAVGNTIPREYLH